MNKRVVKPKGVVKGAPSGFVISIMVHAAAFLLAGMLVVFTVHQKEEKKFVPPKPVDRPKMKLKKPKVKVKKTAKPKATTRIVTKVKRASMPDIQLPEMSGMGEGLGGGMGDGFDIMPDLDEVTMFGGGQSIGNDFVGTFYDMKRNRQGKPIIYSPDGFKEILNRFFKSGWKPSTISQYYRSPRKLYATTFAVPPVQSTLAPEAYGEPDTEGLCWMAHYKGQLVYPEDITIRFWGMGDDLLAVRVDGKIVMLSAWTTGTVVDGHAGDFVQLWQTSTSKSLKYPLGNNLSTVGDWIELKAGVPKDMEVVTSEITGGVYCSLLCVEVQGEEYPKNPVLLGPTLPIFKTEEVNHDLADLIHRDLVPGDASVTNGPVFRDYLVKRPASAPRPMPTDTGPGPLEKGLRVWTSADGKTLEGEFITFMGLDAVFKTGKGRQLKVPVERLSQSDLEYIDLMDPPEFELDFSKKSKQIPPPPASPFSSSATQRPLRIFDYTFGARVKQKTARDYNREVKVEYFAFGEEVEGNNWIYLDRHSESFTPTKANRRSFEFTGDTVRIQSQAIRDSAPMRGTKYGGFVITLTDERGYVFDYKASHEFLYEHLAKIRRLPFGAYFNKQGDRVVPTRPTEEEYPTWVFR